jgi:hypothetical protein
MESMQLPRLTYARSRNTIHDRKPLAVMTWMLALTARLKADVRNLDLWELHSV